MTTIRYNVTVTPLRNYHKHLELLTRFCHNSFMSLTMDGVVRRAPLMTASVRVPKIIPPPLIHPVTSVRFVTGMDGIRRQIAAPTVARAMLASMAEPILPNTSLTPYAAEAMVIGAVPAYHERAWGRQIGFGLVASALIAGGALTWNVVGPVAQVSASVQSQPVVQASSSGPDLAAKAAALAVTAQSAGLDQLLRDFVAANGGSGFGVVVKDLKTGATASVNADASMTSASLYKLFVAQQVMSRIDAGSLTYGASAGGGSGRNVVDCLTVMINVSDNTCGKALGENLGWGSQDGALKEAGYTGTSLAAPQRTSAHDVAYLLERLYRGTLNSGSSNDRLLAMLKDQRVNNRLPVGLPAGTVIAHKTGDLDGYMHDAGIVYGPKTDYVVSMMGAPGTSPSQFADLSAKIWASLQQ